MVNQQGCKDSGAAAQERPRLCFVHGLRQGADPGPLRANPVREATVASDNGPLSRSAKVVISGQAFVAGEAAMSEPAQPHALSEFKPFRRVTQRDDGCYGYLVARHKGIT